MSATQFFPSSFCVAVDGAPNTSVVFQDLNVDNMVYALTKTWVNPQSGTNTPVYEIAYQESSATDLTIYYFPRSSAQSIGQLSAILNSWAPANNMTQYSTCISIGGSPFKTRRNVLINDDKIWRRVWRTSGGVTDTGSTDIYVGFPQQLDYLIFKVNGDQTKAKTYYYNYVWAG